MVLHLWRNRRDKARRMATLMYQCGVDWAIVCKEAGATMQEVAWEVAHLPPDDPFRRGATSVQWSTGDASDE